MMAGDKVRVLAPFDQHYPGEYTLAEHILSEDGTTAWTLVGVDEAAFDPIYLELV
jgi:hypothetical protein